MAGTINVGGASIVPSAIPLAVRTPYLSTWLPGTHLAGTEAMFWNGAPRTFAGLVRIDGHVYTWAGQPIVNRSFPPPMSQTALRVTATRSIFTMKAAGVELIAEWLSPIEPGNPQLQSVPLTLLTVSVVSLDGAPHDVQVYADTAGDWAASDPQREIVWQTTRSGKSRYWTVQVASQDNLSEDEEMALWGTFIWATPRSVNESFQSGLAGTVRTGFAARGVLDDLGGTSTPTPVENSPVFAIACNLGEVRAAGASASFAIGHARQLAVSYGYVTPAPESIPVSQNLQALWTMYWQSPQLMVDDFLAGAAAARERAAALDALVETHATNAYNADYAAMCVMAVRQTYATTELVLGPGGEQWVFLKEISSNDCVNTVDMLYASAPLFLWLDPDYLLMALQPVLDWCVNPAYQNADWGITSLWTGETAAGQSFAPVEQMYCPHALGVYPRALAVPPNEGEQMPVEESAGMMIMMAAWAASVPPATAAAQLGAYALLWTQWADLLLAQIPFPSPQFTTDDWLGWAQLPNFPVGSVNLGLKSIIGLAAAAQIATIIGDEASSAVWSDAATAAVPEWLSRATDASGDHLNLTEGSTGTWGTLYHAYAELMIGTHLLTKPVADMQAAWYGGKIALYGYGMPNQSNDLANCKVGWLMFTAAWLASYQAGYPVVGELMSRSAAYLSSTSSLAPYPDRYNPTTSQENGPRAHPIGAIFALLL